MLGATLKSRYESTARSTPPFGRNVRTMIGFGLSPQIIRIWNRAVTHSWTIDDHALGMVKLAPDHLPLHAEEAFAERQ